MERQVLVRHLDYLSKYANDVILLTDDNGILIEANDKALELYGYTREDLLGQPLARLRTPEALLDYHAQWQQAEQQHGLVFETMHQHKDGSAFPVEVSARIITVDGRRFRQAIIRDISERKKAEDDIVKARDFYLSLLDIFPNPVWRAGIDARCNYFNQAWLDFTGRELAQELGNGWTDGVHPDDLDACMDTYLNAFKDRQPFLMEYRLRYHDGSYHWLADHGRPFFDLHGTFAGYIGSCYDIQQIKVAEERMEFLANHDSLTRLPNRTLLHDRIEQALASARREGRQVAVLFIDLDRFKAINDSLGHAAGDQLLRAFADRLRNCVRDADTVSRLGGDEFIVVIPELREASDAVPVAQKILETMATDFSIEDYNIRITPSIGISAFPHDGMDAQTLDKECRYRHVQRQAERAQRHTVLFAGLIHQRPRAPQHGIWPASRAGARRTRTSLPTPARRAHTRAGRSGGAAALAPPQQRPAAARTVPAHRRNEQPDRDDRTLGIEDGLRAMQRLAGRRHGRAGLRQPVTGAVSAGGSADGHQRRSA